MLHRVAGPAQPEPVPFGPLLAVVVAVLTALVVVGLGLLADVVSAERASSPTRVTVVEDVTREAPVLNQ